MLIYAFQIKAHTHTYSVRSTREWIALRQSERITSIIIKLSRKCILSFGCAAWKILKLAALHSFHDMSYNVIVLSREMCASSVPSGTKLRKWEAWRGRHCLSDVRRKDVRILRRKFHARATNESVCSLRLSYIGWQMVSRRMQVKFEVRRGLCNFRCAKTPTGNANAQVQSHRLAAWSIYFTTTSESTTQYDSQTNLDFTSYSYTRLLCKFKCKLFAAFDDIVRQQRTPLSNSSQMRKSLQNFSQADISLRD